MGHLLLSGTWKIAGSAFLRDSTGQLIAILSNMTQTGNVTICVDYDTSSGTIDDSDSYSNVFGTDTAVPSGKFRAAIDSNDVIHIVGFSTQTGVLRDVVYNTASKSGGVWSFDSSTWTEIAGYTDANPLVEGGDICLNSSGYPQVVYVDRITSKGDMADQIMFTEWTGSSWSTPIQVSARANKTDDYVQPKIFRTASNVTRIVYNGYNVNMASYYRTRTGTVWGNETSYGTANVDGPFYTGSVLVDGTNGQSDFWVQTSGSIYEDTTDMGFDCYAGLDTQGFGAVVGTDWYLFYIEETTRYDIMMTSGPGTWDTPYDSGIETGSDIIYELATYDFSYYFSNHPTNGIDVYYRFTGNELRYHFYAFAQSASDNQSAWMAGGIEASDNQYAYLEGSTVNPTVFLNPGVIEIGSQGVAPGTDSVIQLQRGIIELSGRTLFPAPPNAGSFDFWLNNRTIIDGVIGVAIDDGLDIWQDAKTTLKAKPKPKKPKKVDVPVNPGVIELDGTFAVAATVTDSQDAYLNGTGGVTNSQYAFLAGQENTTDNQAAWLAGGIIDTDNQTAYILGSLDSFDNQAVYINGQDTANDQQSGYLSGSIDTWSQLEVYLAAWATTSGSTDSYLYGQDVQLDLQAAYLGGWEHTSSDLPSYTAGQDNLAYNQVCYLVGQQDTNSSTKSYTKGSTNVSDTLEGYLEGVSSGTDISASQYGYVKGGINDSNSLASYLSGWASWASSIEGYLFGIATSFDSLSAYVVGRDFGYATLSGYLDAHQHDLSGQHSFLWGNGIGLSNVTVYLRGSSTATDQTSAYTTGEATSNAAKSGYLVGSQDTTDNQQAYSHGSQDAQAQKSAYAFSSAQQATTQSGYLNGQSDSTDNTSAYTVGQQSVSDSQGSYLLGSVNTTGQQFGYLNGQDISSSTVSAFVQADSYEWLVPDGDIVGGSWQNELTGSTLWESLNEIPPDDDDYIWYDGVSGSESLTVSLTDPEGDPFTDGLVTVYWRSGQIGGVAQITMRVELLENTTTIAQQDKVITSDYQTFALHLTPEEKASITNPNDLRIRFTVVGVV